MLSESASRPPATIPGAISGSVTCRNAPQAEAPRSRAASSRCGFMPAARLRTTTATNEMQNVTWAMLSWANEPRLSNRATKNSSSDRPITISGVTIGRSRSVSVDPWPRKRSRARPRPSSEPRMVDTTTATSPTWTVVPTAAEQIVVGQQLAVPVRGEGVPHERPPRIVEREDDQHDDRGEQEREDEHRERGQQRVALAAHRRRPASPAVLIRRRSRAGRGAGR